MKYDIGYTVRDREDKRDETEYGIEGKDASDALLEFIMEQSGGDAPAETLFVEEIDGESGAAYRTLRRISKANLDAGPVTFDPGDGRLVTVYDVRPTASHECPRCGGSGRVDDDGAPYSEDKTND